MFRFSCAVSKSAGVVEVLSASRISPNPPAVVLASPATRRVPDVILFRNQDDCYINRTSSGITGCAHRVPRFLKLTS
ncbi:hypothetical protein JTE90_003009 [Oedothorax gibbosus]|uniref:Secreted protein n=1 Tax=Oedothorax gibbosus TaxID=931172 RepID=A0AAV6VDR2_9ARAC|nr:hypothetical protein JTE90_003009 [Oedothorax gibbosus]